MHEQLIGRKITAAELAEIKNKLDELVPKSVDQREISEDRVDVLTLVDLQVLGVAALTGLDENQWENSSEEVAAYVVKRVEPGHDLAEGWVEVYLWVVSTAVVLEIEEDAWFQQGEVKVSDQTLKDTRFFNLRTRSRRADLGTRTNRSRLLDPDFTPRAE